MSYSAGAYISSVYLLAYECIDFKVYYHTSEDSYLLSEQDAETILRTVG
jgi:hypothetical protein